MTRTLALLALLVTGCPPPHACCPDASKDRILSVSGTAELEAMPDEASIVLGFSEKAKRMDQAHRITLGRVEDLVARLTTLGIARDQIVLGTLGYSTNWFYPTGSSPRIDGFTASTSILVKTRKFEELPAILDAGIDAGAASVSDVSFTSTRLPDLKKKARDMAIAATQDKAKQLAEGLGAHLGPVQSISEGRYDASFSDNAIENNFANNVAQTHFRESGTGEGEGGALTPGSFPLHLSIQVTYALE